GEAYGDSVPLLNIMAEDMSAYLYQDRAIVHESKDQFGIFARLSQWSRQALSPGEIPPAIHEALRRMQVNRPRPTTVEIPVDVFRAEGEVTTLAAETHKRPRGDPHDLERAAALLARAERPLLWAGGGVIAAGAWQELRALAEALDIPVLLTASGRGAMSDDHPLVIGNHATQGPVKRLLERADLMLAVGATFGYLPTARWTLPIPKRLIHIDLDPAQPGKNYPVEIGIHADAKHALRALLSALGGAPSSNHDAWVDDARAARQAVEMDLAQRAPLEWGLLQTLRRALPREAVITADPHLLGYWARSHLPIYEPRTWLHDLAFGTLGYAYPVALGAKLGAPDLPVVALSGDGGFLFTGQELATAVKYGLRVPVVIFNDSAYGAIKEDFLRDYGRAYEVDLVNPDFVAYAESFGAKGFRATPETLGATLEQALRADGPSVIDVRVTLRRPLAVA
ncbi:MAG: thiamine pyrophosphate-binding protein, partial [Actinobacteria bacterium]|nr:thiamine pyrophosphate-binding protein [Actinomycetota bacterium]